MENDMVSLKIDETMNINTDELKILISGNPCFKRVRTEIGIIKVKIILDN